MVKTAAAFVILLALGIALPAAAEVPACKGAKAGTKEARQFAGALADEPFYQAMTKKFGPAKSCSFTSHGKQDMSVVYAFDGGTLKATVAAEAESQLETLTWPGLSETEAMDLLHAQDKAIFQGCDIDWSKPQTDPDTKPPAPTRSVEYQGDTCNCRFAKQYKDGALAGLEMSSAC